MSKKSTGKLEFESWRSYWDFRREVARDWRYLRTPGAQKFLEILARESHSRVVEVRKGQPFFRAQVAHHDEFDPEINHTLPMPALPARMRPFPDRATEGRINPKGIPCLYMASDKHTAMAECRPWIGSLVSIGVFRTTSALKIVDCTKGVDSNYFFLEGEPTPKKKSDAVWAQLGRAFRQPATREDNIAEYAPTQIVAEVFRKEGFDGVAYLSAFGTDRYNTAFFDLNAATLIMTELHEVKDVEFKHEQAANPYYVKRDENGDVSLVRNIIVGVAPCEPKDEAS